MQIIRARIRRLLKVKVLDALVLRSVRLARVLKRLSPNAGRHNRVNKMFQVVDNGAGRGSAIRINVIFGMLKCVSSF